MAAHSAALIPGRTPPRQGCAPARRQERSSERADGGYAVDWADVADELQEIGHQERARLLRRQGRLPVRLPPEIGLRIPVHEADEDLGDDPCADRPQPLAVLADVRLLQD